MATFSGIRWRVVAAALTFGAAPAAALAANAAPPSGSVTRSSPAAVATSAALPGLRLTDSSSNAAQGTVTLTVQGSGFAPGVRVTLAGRDAAFYEVQTGIPQSPTTGATCAPVSFGPVQAAADGAGQFTAMLVEPDDRHTGGQVVITASVPGKGAIAKAGAVTPEGRVVASLPAGCRYINPPTAAPGRMPTALPRSGGGGTAKLADRAPIALSSITLLVGILLGVGRRAWPSMGR